MLLVVLILYLFGLVFMQATTGYLERADADAETSEKLLRNWGTVFKALTSLYMAITGGDDWANIGDPLRKVGDHYYVIFLFYISVLFFAILNIVTGIFLQNAER